MPSAWAHAKWCSRDSMARRAVVTVLSLYLGIAATNSAIQLSLCQVGAGFMSSGASFLSIHFRPLMIVDGCVQTSALEADS